MADAITHGPRFSTTARKRTTEGAAPGAVNPADQPAIDGMTGKGWELYDVQGAEYRFRKEHNGHVAVATEPAAETPPAGDKKS
jgi:hypothetical protein